MIVPTMIRPFQSSFNFPLEPFSRFIPPNRCYVSIYGLTDRKWAYGKGGDLADLTPVSESEAMTCESLPTHITVTRNLLREPHTNYPCCCMHACRYSRSTPRNGFTSAKLSSTRRLTRHRTSLRISSVTNVPRHAVARIMAPRLSAESSNVSTIETGA